MEDDVKAVVSLGFIALVIFVVGIVFFGWFGLMTARPMAKYAEETRTQVYERSRAYEQGLRIDFADLCRQLAQADDEQIKSAIRETIQLRADRSGVTAPCVN